MSEQSITIVGALGGPPELRYTASGQAVSNFSVACSRRWQNRQTKEWEEDTTWFRVTAWATLAENVAASLDKGARVVVSGRMQSRKWTTEAGETRYSWDLVADEIAPSLRWATAQVDQIERSESLPTEPT